MYHTIRTLTLAAAGILVGSAAHAAGDPSGIWFDHNGRGAVEIAPCASGNGMCGYVVHIKEAKNAKRCGMQILGNVTQSGGGWIYSPDRGKKYSVELTRLSDDKLRVVGNAGSFFSKTYTWNRAPDDVAVDENHQDDDPERAGGAHGRRHASESGSHLIARHTSPGGSPRIRGEPSPQLSSAAKSRGNLYPLAAMLSM